MAALSYTRQATKVARTLLEVAPDYADAYLATGISQYIVGSLTPPLRWILGTVRVKWVGSRPAHRERADCSMPVARDP